LPFPHEPLPHEGQHEGLKAFKMKKSNFFLYGLQHIKMKLT